ncbi:MAG: PspC domain-containing protein [Eubacteriales bacterium]
MNNQLHKSQKDKMILGVCGGVAEYFEIDSSIVRILWAITSLVFGTGVILYLIAAFIFPYGNETEWDETEVKKSQPKINRTDQRNVIGIILIICGLFILLKNFSFIIDFDYLWSILLVVLGVVLILKGKEKRDKDEE